MPPRITFVTTLPLLRRATAGKRAIHASPRMQTPHLVTWDIDGTLLAASGRAGNAAHKRAIDEAVAAVHRISATVNDVPHAGCTDLAIVRSMCRLGAVPEAAIDASMPAVLADASERIARYVEADLTHLVLPGVVRALEALRARGVALALTTGNLERAAWAKVSAAGLHPFFDGGAFGSECEDRADILRTAIGRVAGADVELARVVHVGDAVADVRAARVVGARGVGVLTGAFDRAELESEQPLAVLDDLADTSGFLKVLGFED